jgi:hypothetical protein
MNFPSIQVKIKSSDEKEDCFSKIIFVILAYSKKAFDTIQRTMTTQQVLNGQIGSLKSFELQELFHRDIDLERSFFLNDPIYTKF